MHTVGQVAKLAGISVRTLHHYDEIGLVSPSERSPVGYRLYSMCDLERLQRVLFYKELGFTLDEIRGLLTDSTTDRHEALAEQRAELGRRVSRLKAMIHLIDETLVAIEKGETMQPEEMFGVFGDFDPAEYEREAAERWGHTPMHKESVRRAKGYAREDWERIRADNLAVTQRMLDAFDRGVKPTDPEAIGIAESARLIIDRAFYTCSREMHEQLAQLYLTDERFRSFYEDQRTGLAAWFAAAIEANARGIPRT